MKLSIIIPAYNEEESIESVIKKCLQAKEQIVKVTSVEEVDIVVVSDGSSDNTVELANKFVPQIQVISYTDNRGYGRALKIGFESANVDLVSFLDADGTIEPASLIDLINKLLKEDADICIGSRMGPHSKMPKIRKIGNLIFKNIINLISRTNVSDIASGIRVIRKEKLNQIYPLPDGLHFTPAMSCRAILDPNLKIVEVEIRYEERQGKSKLNVIKDGIRFLKVILSTSITYKPLLIMGTFGVGLILMSSFYGSISMLFYLKNGFITEDHIYRLIPVMVFGVSGVLFLGLGSVTEKAVRLFHNNLQKNDSLIIDFVEWSFSWKRLWFIAPLLFLISSVLNYESIISWFKTGKFVSHWSLIVAGGFLALLGIVGFTLGVIDYIMDLIEEKQRYL